MYDDVRTMLRIETRADHDRVDGLFSSVDLSRRGDYTLFLTVHLTCFRALTRTAQPGHRAALTLLEMVGALDCDLATLGGSADAIPTPLLIDLDPLAIDYIVAGSRMGTRVLRKRWEIATDTSVRRANAYFGLPDDPLLWRNTCTDLTALAADDPRATTIVQDARRIFAAFAEAFAQSAHLASTKEPAR